MISRDFKQMALGALFAIAGAHLLRPEPVARAISPDVIAALHAAGTGYQAPLDVLKARRASFSTTAGSVRDKLGIADSDGDCSVTVFPVASQINIGGSDVENSTKFVSICSSGCDITNPVTIDARSTAVFIRGATGTVSSVPVLVGGGCSG